MDTKFRARVADTMSSIADIAAKESSVINEMIDFAQDADMIAKRIGSLELDADALYHSIFLEIRENGHQLDKQSFEYWDIVGKLEQCTDAIEDLAIAFNSFNVTSLREDYIPSLIAVEQAAQSVVSLAVAMRNPHKLTPIQLAIIEINHSKDVGINMYSECMRNLFIYEKDPIEIIRWKEIYSLTKEIFVAYEDLADACEGYILRYSSRS